MKTYQFPPGLIEALEGQLFHESALAAFEVAPREPMTEARARAVICARHPECDGTDAWIDRYVARFAAGQTSGFAADAFEAIAWWMRNRGGK